MLWDLGVLNMGTRKACVGVESSCCLPLLNGGVTMKIAWLSSTMNKHSSFSLYPHMPCALDLLAVLWWTCSRLLIPLCTGGSQNWTQPSWCTLLNVKQRGITISPILPAVLLLIQAMICLGFIILKAQCQLLSNLSTRALTSFSAELLPVSQPPISLPWYVGLLHPSCKESALGETSWDSSWHSTPARCSPYK